MNLEKWLEYGWLKEEPSSPDEIGGLLGIVTRALKDAKVEAISDDLRFQAAFSAALTKRNATSYDSAGSTSEQDLEQAIKVARELQRNAVPWLNQNHPELMKSP